MLCPKCEIKVLPSEILHELEIVEYTCPECLTDWHYHLGGNAPAVVIRDGSTLEWLVTDESNGDQKQVPGWRQALTTINGMMLDHLEIHAGDDTTPIGVLEFTASAYPEHPALEYGMTTSITITMQIGKA